MSQEIVSSRDELVVSHEYAEIYILKNDGELGAGHWIHKKVASGGKFDDIDQDGDLDIFTTDEKGLQDLWFENPAKKEPGD